MTICDVNDIVALQNDKRTFWDYMDDDLTAVQDSDVLGEDGFYVQEYTVHIGKPIYPDPDSAVGENAERMKDENYLLWKNIYENNYGIPLVYA